MPGAIGNGFSIGQITTLLDPLPYEVKSNTTEQTFYINKAGYYDRNLKGG